MRWSDYLPGEDDPEPPPFLGTWPNVYRAVLAWLALVILVFYGFTRYFA